MTNDIIMYIAIFIIGGLIILSFVIGLEKMIKIILGNYIVGSVCLAASQAIKLLINYLIANPDLRFLWLGSKALVGFLTNGQATIIFILYVLLLFLIYKKSSVTISMPDDEIIQKSLYLVLVPLTVLSIILAVEICLIGVEVISPTWIQLAELWFGNNKYVQWFIVLTPVWVLIHWLATIIVTSEFKMNIKTDL